LGEFAKEMPCPHALGGFLRSSFKIDYREISAISAKFVGNLARILRNGD